MLFVNASIIPLFVSSGVSHSMCDGSPLLHVTIARPATGALATLFTVLDRLFGIPLKAPAVQDYLAWW